MTYTSLYRLKKIKDGKIKMNNEKEIRKVFVEIYPSLIFFPFLEP